MVPNAPASGAFQHRTDMATGEWYDGMVEDTKLGLFHFKKYRGADRNI